MTSRRYHHFQMAASALLMAALFFTQLCGVACGFSACLTAKSPAPPVAKKKAAPSCHHHEEEREDNAPPAEEKSTGHNCTDHETGVLLTGRELSSPFDFLDAGLVFPAPFSLPAPGAQSPAKSEFWSSRKPPPLRIPQQSVLRI